MEPPGIRDLHAAKRRQVHPDKNAVSTDLEMPSSISHTDAPGAPLRPQLPASLLVLDYESAFFYAVTGCVVSNLACVPDFGGGN